MRHVDVLILGAGAAGLMTGIETGKRGRRTLIVDHADRPGKKILISGGGRSNFTNLHTSAENFLSENPHFARSALARYTPQDFISLVEAHGIPYHEKTLGQLFCDRTAHDLVNLLLRECERSRSTLELGTPVLEVTRSEAGGSRGRFVVTTGKGPVAAESLVVATGGLSIAKIGATGLGYDLARQFSLEIVTPRPALVPLTLDAADRARWTDLAGVSAEVVVSAPQPSGPQDRRKKGPPAFREKMLVTHRGLSGPAILQISSYWQPGRSISLDLAPQGDVFASLLSPGARRDEQAAANCVRTRLPARFAERWLAHSLPPTAARDLSNATLGDLESRMHAWQFTPNGTEGFEKAEVTAGGVSTAELDPRTLECRRIPGLFFVGEVVDVTGWLGGYNFQWAWASGFCAGQVA